MGADFPLQAPYTHAACRAYLAFVASNGGLEAAMLIPLLPLTLQAVVVNITAAIKQVQEALVCKI